MNRAEHEKREAIARKFADELCRFVPDDERVVFTMPPEMSGTPDESPEDARKRNYTFSTAPYKPGKYLPDNDANAFICISSFRSMVDAKGKTRWSRAAKSFGRGLAIMVDDIGSGVGSKGNLNIEHFASVLPPTVIVETSPSNYQLWYFLSTPEPNVARFKAFLESFVDNVLGDAGGDRTIKDVSRIGRLPLGLNNKRTEDGTYKYVMPDGSLFRPRALYADYANRYDIDVIATAFNFQIAEHVRVARDEDSESDEFLRIKTHKSRERAADRRALDLAVLFYERAGMDIGLNTAGGYRIKCPWGNTDHPHRNGDDAHIRGPGREYDIDFIFKCAHDTCIKKGRKWDTFVDLVVLPRIEDALEKANADARNHPYKDEP